MSPTDQNSDSGIYEDGLLSERQGAEQIEGLQKEVLRLQGRADDHAEERRREWNRVNTWAMAANIALFSVAMLIAIGVTTHNFFLGSELREKGERLTIVEERLRQVMEMRCDADD